MKPIPKRLPSVVGQPIVIRIRQRVDLDTGVHRSTGFLANFDDLLRTFLQRWSVSALRVSLGLVFIWFGILKTLGVSPVVGLIHQTFTFLPIDLFVPFLGGWEILIGLGLILKRALRCTLILMCIHLIGTFVAMFLAPSHFFSRGIPPLLTADGEFIMKNIVFLAAAFVVGGLEARPFKKGSTLTERGESNRRFDFG